MGVLGEISPTEENFELVDSAVEDPLSLGVVAKDDVGAALGLNSLIMAGLTFCDIKVGDVIGFLPPPRTPNILPACDVIDSGDVIENLGIPPFNNGEVGRQAGKLANGDWIICRCLAASSSIWLDNGFVGENPWKGRKGNPPMNIDGVAVGSTLP